MSPREDLRTVKTKKALHTSLLVLMERKSFDDITVSELCTEALVSRAAFYAHFADKHALLDYALRCKQEELAEQASDASPDELFRNALALMKDDTIFYRNLLLNKFDWRIVEMVQNLFADLIEQRVSGVGETQPSPAALYCAGGLTSLTFWWIRNDFPVPVEEMAAMQADLLKRTLEEKS